MYISTKNYLSHKNNSVNSDTTSSIGIQAQFNEYTGRVCRFTEVGILTMFLPSVVSVGSLGLCGVRMQTGAGDVGIDMIPRLNGVGLLQVSFVIKNTQYRDLYPSYSYFFEPVLCNELEIRVYDINASDHNLWMQRIWMGNRIHLDEVGSSTFTINDLSKEEKSSLGTLFTVQKKMYRELALNGVRIQDNLFNAGIKMNNDYETAMEAFSTVGIIKEVLVSAVGPQDGFHGHMQSTPVAVKTSGLQYNFNLNIREF